ncbi:MarR family transcriptional regulator [Microbacterium excoecariae]|uniref:MarR family transcriptional regulator n=1 Tax=Microbacterium excoecariae TaxID=2715210 RepID=UPI00140B93F8|nr:helix-turn-helix domain-containing protein [Microbacterium excoecariae]NHI15949.1 helix-turn-helix domain-containing protein [Microbacterium excoecariae]
MTLGDEQGLHAKQPRAIHSAFVVLEEVARAGPGVTVRDLVSRLAMPRATVYRLVNLLVQDEYLVRLADISGLALGRKVADLAGAVASPAPIRATRAVRAELERIRGSAGSLAVHVIGFERGALVAVDLDPRAHALPAALARDPDRSAAARLRDLPAGEGAADLTFQMDDLVPGRACAAVPIRAEDGAIVAALCVGGASTDLDDILRFARASREGADRVGALIA